MGRCPCCGGTSELLGFGVSTGGTIVGGGSCWRYFSALSASIGGPELAQFLARLGHLGNNLRILLAGH